MIRSERIENNALFDAGGSGPYRTSGGCSYASAAKRPPGEFQCPHSGWADFFASGLYEPRINSGNSASVLITASGGATSGRKGDAVFLQPHRA